MIEIKKQPIGLVPGIEFFTIYKDLINDGVNFTTLKSMPYEILIGQGINNCVVPFNLIIDYYSIGITTIAGNFNISSFSAIGNGSQSAMFNFLPNTNQDQSGIITTGINYQSQFCGLNQYLGEYLYLWTNFDDTQLAFTRFRIYFTYYIQQIAL